eukprot:jgi/Botrbrau1/4153/Bobra.0192s0021.2
MCKKISHLCGRSISRVYMRGACVGTRNNDFGLQLPDCTNSWGNVLKADGPTCQTVFAHGPRGTFQTLTRSHVTGNPFDTGLVCNPNNGALIFAMTTCPAFRDTSLNFQQTANRGACSSRKGASVGAIAGGTVSAFFLIISAILVAVFCCQAARARRNRPPAQVAMQGYPMGGPGGMPGAYGGPLPGQPGGPGYAAGPYGAAPYGANYDQMAPPGVQPAFGAPGTGVYPPQGMPPHQSTDAPGKIPPMTTATVEGYPVSTQPPFNTGAGRVGQGAAESSNLPSYMQGGNAAADGKPPPGYPTI